MSSPIQPETVHPSLLRLLSEFQESGSIAAAMGIRRNSMAKRTALSQAPPASVSPKSKTNSGFASLGTLGTAAFSDIGDQPRNLLGPIGTRTSYRVSKKCL